MNRLARQCIIRYCNLMAERKDFWQLAPMGGAYPWLPLRSLSCHLDNRSRDCLGSSSHSPCSCSAPPLSHDPALRGDFRNPHSQNLTCLHQRRKDGNKSYPSKTKTVQILLWPGRRPSFHFSHFESFFLHFSSHRPSSAQGNPVALRPGPSPRNAY